MLISIEEDVVKQVETQIRMSDIKILREISNIKQVLLSIEEIGLIA